MLKPEQIPDEVVKRFATWQFPKCTNNLMRAMLADALNAWPGMSLHQQDINAQYSYFVLPLSPQENPNG